MGRRLRLGALCASFLAWLPYAAQPAIAIEGVSVIDVDRGRRSEPRTVLIVDGRIAAIDVAGAAVVPPGALHIDGRGRFLIPGLVDMHVHLFNNASHRPPNDWAFPLFVADGVTAVREMSTEPAAMAQVQAWRDAVARGELVAPRVLAAGTAVGTGSIEDARVRIRAAHAAGVDFVKVFSEVLPPVWAAVLEEARAQGMPVYGHAPAALSAVAAADAGLRSDEHLMQVYEACSARQAGSLAARAGLSGEATVELRDEQEQSVLTSFTPGVCAEAAAALARSGQVQVPTLVLAHREAQATPVDHRDDPRWARLRSDEQARWTRILDARGAGDDGLAQLRWEVSCRIVQALHRARVPILAGTDAPMPLVYPGAALHDELELLVGCGLSPAEALRAATLGPVEFLGMATELGTVAPGKRADLVLLDADPLVRIGNTRRIRAVLLAGQLIQR